MLGIAVLLLPSLALASSLTQVKIASASGLYSGVEAFRLKKAGSRNADADPLPKGAPVKQLMPWYKTGDEIHDALHALTENCPGAEASLTTEFDGDLGLDVFKVSRSTSSSTPKTKAMFVFGEHARELISPESGLHFAKKLCSQDPQADSELNDVEFTLIPNANPIARKLVEKGAYCKRTNENSVDLNRNWGDTNRDESLAGTGDETDPGPSGFSEKETKVLKGIVDSLRPDIYLSIHSGAYLLGEPYGYTQDKKPVDQSSMTEVLEPISKKYCNGQCPYGGLAKMIDYANGGCDIDYVYGKTGSPYVFTWEIYTGDRFRETYVDKAAEINAEAAGRSFLQRAGRSKMQSGEQSPESDEDVKDCISQFLPTTQTGTQLVVENWSSAYLELCSEVVKKRHQTAA